MGEYGSEDGDDAGFVVELVGDCVVVVEQYVEVVVVETVEDVVHASGL